MPARLPCSGLGAENDVRRLDQRSGLDPRGQAQLLHGFAGDDGVHLGAAGKLEHHFGIHRAGWTLLTSPSNTLRALTFMANYSV